MNLAFIPSPSTGVLHLGPIPLRGYAFCIIIGVFVAVWLGNKRWVARGGKPGTVADIAVWAVPFGLVGGRLYHVITDYQLYFGEGRDWVDAFKIWEGGLGIWGAIALGAVGAWIGCRRRGIPLPAWADALAPGIALAQACGRWGNWFNQELYGRATDLPWAVEITDGPNRVAGTYHPTFLYESLWCIGVALLVIWADRRFTLGHGRAFALYVAAYCVGRGWIEYMRVDEAHHILGLRLNVWTSIVVFVLAVVYLVLSAKLRPGREEVVEPEAVAVAGAKDGDTPAADGKAKDADAKGAVEAGAAADADAEPKDAEAEADGEAEAAAAAEGKAEDKAEAPGAKKL
ncbi:MULTISPECIES: prolipoprotein diacylglyceryl transferase [unclassified Streptomyces]|uniref:prolipoprotein diacylglyceryl transferase n=1 Tax=unclassified Streptomyces TaxID=2593676 RepID=UPI00202DC989|nr:MULTISPECIES: prolipoprotein diacylglyceryl transferase [unclassified Streptomyces]MCM1970121.1 prolipoprotein diacylglyceryl transferase [Streptomyces sp. G1]MCX5298984.1 prolipoprotein diacylglyceryl transferase [Streptomyces sp. NBC_00193]